MLECKLCFAEGTVNDGDFDLDQHDIGYWCNTCEGFNYINEDQEKHKFILIQDVEFIRKTINEKDSDILIAEIDNGTVVFLLIQELITPSYKCLVEHKYAFITDIIVGTKYQNQGIGSALLLEAKKWAENRNLDYLELNVLSENTGAITLYEKQGFKDVRHNLPLRKKKQSRLKLTLHKLSLIAMGCYPIQIKSLIIKFDYI
ncbi:GNAT family N-acetyltransferase (plasmid) [Bacillus sp. N5-665]|uniref:GNAT family N-acetyltransferase n=1 Tax=Bacillus sp. N5-665 TaxID=2925318 RepID=UPI001F52C2E9|nr:GNAT family N-acetyltransferase [Bacillus sp. N5-665]UNK31095.1 GNAT family N-acetyltransferase [Bacillus sp. N5-665]